jgi:hypothetical protein
MVRTNNSTHSADEILRLIELMPAPERERFFRMIEGRPDLSEKWAIVPLTVLRLMVETQRKLRDYLIEHGRLLVEYANIAWRRSNCARVKSERQQHRRKLIRQMLAAGQADAAKIRKELLNEFGIDVELQTVRNDISAIRRA